MCSPPLPAPPPLPSPALGSSLRDLVMSRESAAAPRWADVIYSNVTPAGWTTRLSHQPTFWLGVTPGGPFFVLWCFVGTPPPLSISYPCVSTPTKLEIHAGEASTPLEARCSLITCQREGEWVRWVGARIGTRDIEKHWESERGRDRISEWVRAIRKRSKRFTRGTCGRSEWREEQKKHDLTLKHVLSLCTWLRCILAVLVCIAFSDN